MLIYEITDAANSPYALRLNVSDLLGSNHREASKIRHYGGARLSRGHIIRWKLPNCNVVVRSLRRYYSIPWERKKTVPLLCLRYLWFLSLPSASRDWTSWLCQDSWVSISPTLCLTYNTLITWSHNATNDYFFFCLISNIKVCQLRPWRHFPGSHALQDNIGLRHSSSLCWAYLSHRYKQDW